MLNAKRKKSKNILFSLILCLAMTLSAFAGFNFAKKTEVMASTNYIVNDVSSDLLSNYYNFYTTSTAKPATPSGWTQISENKVNEDNIIKGIVDLTDETTFKTSTYKTTRPTMEKEQSSDSAYFKNLMINSHNGEGSLGYKSNSITLEADSYYAIKVKLYTHRTDSTSEYGETDPEASIYLSGLTDDEDLQNQVKFENINTLTSWDTYTFYIDTDSSININVELWLGSKSKPIQGAVFFNSVKIFRYSEDKYYEDVLNSRSDTENKKYHIISLSKSEERNLSPVLNSSFENTSSTLRGWKTITNMSSEKDAQICDIVEANHYTFKVDNDTTISAPGSNNSPNNQLCLFMYNKEDARQAIESTEIAIDPLEYYKITFWAKSDCDTGDGATVYLVDKSETDAIESAELNLSTTLGSNEYRNNWTQYSFYVYGDKVDTKSVTIQIWLGTDESKTSGYVFIDDFRMEKITYYDYSNNSSSTNAAALNFNDNSDLFVVVNSNFNKTANEDNQLTYPLTPIDWDKSGDTNINTFSGVISAKEDSFESNKDNYTNTNIYPTRPADHPIYGDDNNVLMIGSTSENNSQTYTSASLSLSADSYYKLSYYVFTSYAKIDKDNNYGASVSLTTSDQTLYEQFNILFDDNNWHQYIVYIKTGATSETASLNLTFNGLTGYVFFDDIRLETSQEEIFNNYTILPENQYTKVDLSVDNFDNRTYGSYEKLQKPNNWTASEQGVDDSEFTVTNTGIIDVANYDGIDVNGTLSGNANALYINSLHNTNFAYTSNSSYTFSAQTYYKISVNILTKYIDSSNNENNKNNYGARISLAGSDEIYFKNINTNGGWKTYSIYLSLEEELSSKIVLALGDTDEKVSGIVLFDNLRIESMDQEDFLTELRQADESVTARFINYTESTDEDDDEESTWSNEFDWLILPSLLTAIALIIAVVGFYVRRIKVNRKPKIKTKYDRRKTLDKDIDRRERIALRQQIIDELNEELLSIDKEIEEYTRVSQEQLEILKNKILAEKEEIKRQKIDIEIRKKEATSEREKQLKANPDLVSNKKAEKDFTRFMEKLDKQEMHLQKQLNLKDIKLANSQEEDNSKLSKFLERKEFIKNEITKIEMEIEAIAKEEAGMWEEYKQAKLEAKKRKNEIKMAQKEEKVNSKKPSTTPKTPTKQEKVAKDDKLENNSKSKKSVKQNETKETDKTDKTSK